jgi:hypothetical protein
MARLILYVTAVLAWQSLSLVCQAQLVQVGPGYVKAPFVRVYSYPNGGSYVRAPFVGVFSPGYDMYPVAPALPTRSELAQMSWASLAQAIRQWTVQLNTDLDSQSPSVDWKPFLETSEIVALLPAAADAPPSEEVRRQLQEALDRFHAVRQTSEAQSVTTLPSFQLVEALLGEYVLPPDVRLRRQLFSAAGELSRSLERYTTGSDWQTYLALAPGLALSQANVDEPPSPQNLAELTTARERFDAVSQSDDFRTTTNLPAFALTRQRLTEYLQQATASHSQAAEELPTPRPSAP